MVPCMLMWAVRECARDVDRDGNVSGCLCAGAGLDGSGSDGDTGERAARPASRMPRTRPCWRTISQCCSARPLVLPLQHIWGGRRTERGKGGGRDGGKEREKEEEADGGDVGVVRSVTMLSRGSATLDCNRMGRWTRRPRRTCPPHACTRRPRLAAHVGRKRMGIGSGGSGCEIICRLVPCLREGDGVTRECIGWMNGRSKMSTCTRVSVQWRMRTSRMTVRQA